VTLFGIGIDVVENPRIAEAIRFPALAFADGFER
jgi:phosphopantetheinyl transferase (holo-ACP synthase)